MHICVTRFNNKTYNENIRFRNTHNIKCIYGTPKKITETILPNEYIIVLEMNNDKNKIEGIGIIKNQLCYDKYIIYEDNNYNRYIYISNKYININSLDTIEIKLINELEQLLFKTKLHMKRGSGIQLLPKYILNNILLIKILKNICKERYSNFQHH